MSSDYLERLAQASTEAERTAIVLEISLSSLSEEVKTAVYAAAIPHWFNITFLDALLQQESDDLYDELLTLSFVEQIPHKGYAIHDRTRALLLQALWQQDPNQFRTYSQLAADYCANQDTTDSTWQAESIYHLLISDPTEGVANLRSLTTKWANYEFHTYDEIEHIIRLANEQITAGRLSGAGANWTRLWQARLALIFNRPNEAIEPLNQLSISADDDPFLLAEVAQTQGDLAAKLNQPAEMERAWRTAHALYQQLPNNGGRLDAYLLAEKMRQHNLTLEAHDNVAQPTPKPPSATRLKLIDNISYAWIEGVLNEAVDETIDLTMARDDAEPSNLVYHQPHRVDQPLLAGQRLSGLFEAAGRSLLILGAPGSGKTITLLQLLNDLLTTARADGNAPVPLLFNLSSFGKFIQEHEDGTLIDWLAEQAYSQYRLNRQTTRQDLLAGDQFTLLLDGLDEVPATDNQREQCVTAINSFMNETPCGLAICSRIGDYDTLQNKLHLAQALVLQPLSNRQIEAFLAQQSDIPHQEAMVARVNSEWQLREVLRSPLLLNLYAQTFPYLPQTSPQTTQTTVEEVRQALFAGYVDAVSGSNQAEGDTDENKNSFRWLSFLASQMQEKGTTLFYIEDLQPTWLPQRLVDHYRTLYGLYLATVIMIFIFFSLGMYESGESRLLALIIFEALSLDIILCLWLTKNIKNRLIKSIIILLISYCIIYITVFFITIDSVANIDLQVELQMWLFASLSVASLTLFFLLGICWMIFISSFNDKIKIKEKILFSNVTNQKISLFARNGSIIGIALGFLFALFMLINLNNNSFLTTIGGINLSRVSSILVQIIIYLTIFGRFMGMTLSFINVPIVDKRPRPGIGANVSLHNGLMMTAIATLFFGLPIGFLEWRAGGDFFILFLVLVNILPPTFTWFGGLAWAQHWALRRVLARQGWLPFRLVPWLERMVARGLLRRVGGGYIFLHRSLLEYFAEQAPTNQ